MPAALSPNLAAPSWWPGSSVASNTGHRAPLTLGSLSTWVQDPVCVLLLTAQASMRSTLGAWGRLCQKGKEAGQRKARPGRASSNQDHLAAGL